MSTRSRWAVAGVGVALLAGIGCSGPAGPATYPVAGKVVFKGKGDVGQLAGGTVHFELVGATGVTGGGEVRADGTFAVGCYLDGRDRDGLPAGDYRVCVRPPRDKADARRRAGPVAARFQSFDTSRLTVTVAAGTNAPTIEVEAGR